MIDCMCYSFCPKADSSECNSRCIKNIELSYLLKNCGIPMKRQCITTIKDDGIDKKAVEVVRSLATDIVKIINDGTNIILYSNKTGNGKTTMAINLMLSYFNEIWAGNGFRDRGYFLYVPTYLNRCKDNISRFDDELDALKKHALFDDVLILDDLGSTKTSEYDVSLLSTIINERLLAEKSIIVTTNCDRRQLASMIGERLTDRLWSTSVLIHLNADSYRGIV